jgi:hypothetical protein
MLSCKTHSSRRTTRLLFSYQAFPLSPAGKRQNFWLLLNSPEAPLGAGGIVSTICGVRLPS